MKPVLILWLAVETMLGAVAERPAIALLPFNHPPDDKEAATWSHLLMRDLEYPERVDLRFVRVTCHLRLDDSEGALAAGRDPVVLTSRLLLNQQANVLILFGEWDAAGKMMNLAQELPARAPEQLYQLSSPMLALLGRFSEALADHIRLKDTAYGREHQEEAATFQKALTTMADWDRQIRQRLAGGRAPDAEARSLLQQASEGHMHANLRSNSTSIADSLAK